jgi:lipoate-protein ligase A
MIVRGSSKPAGCKLLRIEADIDEGLIRSIMVRGDFFAVPEEGFERIEARLAGTAAGSLASRFEELVREEGVEVLGISGEGLAAALAEATRAGTL